MLPIWFYLVSLFIAPQLWVEPLLGLRIDLLVYPLWVLALTLRGRLGLVFRFGTQDWFLAGFVGWAILTMVVNPQPPRFDELAQNYLKWLLMYRLTAASIDSPATLRKASWAILVTVGVIAIEAIQHLLGGEGWARQGFAWVDASAASVGVEHRTRWVGIFDGPGVFCVMFTIALPFALQYAARAYGKAARVMAVVVGLPLYGYAIFSTGSRGGMLTALAILGFWVLSRYEITVKRIVLSAVIAVAAMMVGPSYLTSTTDAEHSAQHRVDMWVEGLEMAQSHPIVGIGRGNFAGYTGMLIAHNSGIELMGETGFVGLFLWFGVIYCGFRALAARSRESPDPKERELLNALGLSLVGYLVSSLFVTLEYETLYFVLGLTAGVRNFTQGEAPYAKRDAKIMGAIVVSYFVLIKLFAMTY